MKGSADIFDFTLADAADPNRDPVMAVRAAAQVLCVQLRPEHLPPDLSVELAGCVDDFFAAISQNEPNLGQMESPAERLVEWHRWSAAVRESVGKVFESYKAFVACLSSPLPVSVSVSLARITAEVLRWDLIDRQAPNPDAWALLGQLFLQEVDDSSAEVGGISGGVTREFVRALAYHSAALDQFPPMGGMAVCKLVDVLLPFLSLQRNCPPGALYLVNPPQSPVPVRLSRPLASPGWCYHAKVACEFLAEIHGQLIRGSMPGVLAGMEPRLVRESAVHLRRHWSVRPPVRRFRRHAVDGGLSVVRGYEQIKGLFRPRVEVTNGAWRIVDLSRGGVGALVYHDGGDVPDSGELLAFRPQDGSSWHLGVVRRVRQAKDAAEVGIETLSIRPELVRTDDGLVTIDLLFCDPVLRGEAVRVIAPENVLRPGAPLFVTAEGRVSKLKPLEGVMFGTDYELRVYQVL